MSSNKTVIAVDAMGGDLGPSVVVPGAIEAARQTGAKILLVGNEATLDGELNRLSPSGVDLEIVHAPEVAGMDEKPSDILRRKKNASIQVACRLVRDGAAQGVVSAGHSGASVACGMFIMGRIPGVERPALASLLPTEKEPVVLLDVGATVDCKPYNIFQFGLMGDAFARDILNKESPRVGLLSIGEEEGKGNSQVKEAYELFKMAQNLNFSGNIEGRDLFTGEMDVAVCDGFVGNVALKLSEGLGPVPEPRAQARTAQFRLPAQARQPAGQVRVQTLRQSGGLRRIRRSPPARPSEHLHRLPRPFQCQGHLQRYPHGDPVRREKTNKRLMETICANEELTRFGRSC